MHDYDDRGWCASVGCGRRLADVGIERKAVAAVGLSPKDAATLCEGDAPRAPTTGAQRAAAGAGGTGRRLDERAAARVRAGDDDRGGLTAGAAIVVRDERPPQDVARQRVTAGPEIGISLPAYERAFDAKVRLEAGRCPHCGTLALPPRYRCLGCGAEGDAVLVALPRDATVYTNTTIHTPVPGLATPYTIVIVELGDTGVRLLAQVTGVPPGTVGIGDRGEMVLRRVAERSGIPDYGYAFAPSERSDDAEVGR